VEGENISPIIGGAPCGYILNFVRFSLISSGFKKRLMDDKI
jgi:hypothetical protein